MRRRDFLQFVSQKDVVVVDVVVVVVVVFVSVVVVVVVVVSEVNNIACYLPDFHQQLLLWHPASLIFISVTDSHVQSRQILIKMMAVVIVVIVTMKFVVIVIVIVVNLVE